MIVEQSKQIVEEIRKAFIGKTEIIEKVLMTIYCWRMLRVSERQHWHWHFPKCLDSAINVFSLQQIHCRQILPVLRCLTVRRMNLNTGKELQTVSFFWQMRSTVLHRRRSQRFWRLWKKIPSVSMVRHMCCHCRLSVSQHRTRWDSPEHSRCRSHS